MALTLVLLSTFAVFVSLFASKVTTIWRYTNVYIIIIIIIIIIINTDVILLQETWLSDGNKCKKLSFCNNV